MNTPRSGRVPLQVPPLSAFTTGFGGKLPIVPKNREFCYDDTIENGPHGHILYKPGVDPDGIITPMDWTFVSATKIIEDTITDLDNSGIFINAAAGSLSRDLTFFIFSKNELNPNNHTITLNPNLSYPSTYRYYAVRKGTNYITGHINPDTGIVMTNLVNMREVAVNVGNGTVSKPSIGVILPTMINQLQDGDSYIVEFFDLNKKMIFRDTFQAEAVKSLTNDMIGGNIITGMDIVTSRPVNNSPNTAYFYIGDNPRQLTMRALLKYVDSSTIDITNELNTGRLVINGLDSIDTSYITEAEMQKFTVTYYYNGTENIVGITNNITTEVSVIVVQDESSNISEFIPIHYPVFANSSLTYKTRLYSVRTTTKNGETIKMISEITGSLKAPVILPENVTNNTAYNVSATVKLGITGQNEQTYDYSIKFFDVDNVGNKVTICKAHNSRPFVDNYYKLLYTKESGIPKLFLSNGLGSSDIVTMINENKDGENTPFKIRIRNLDNTCVYYDGMLSATGYRINENSNGIITQNQPIIIEFLQRVENGAIVVFSITKVRVAYVTINS